MVSCWRTPTTKDAYRLSWVSLAVTLVAAGAGIGMYVATGSSLCLVFGLENCVDFLSSAVVLWRFFAPTKVNQELEEKLHRREKRASVAISFILVLLGMSIISTAISDFARGEEDPDGLRLVVAISFFSFIVFGILATLKFRYAKALQSASLNKDGICSLIGTVLAGALFVNTLIIEQKGSWWWLDPTVALLCGFGAIAIGIHAVHMARYSDDLPVFTMTWWFLSQGDGTDELSGRPLGPEDYPQGKASNMEMSKTHEGGDDNESAEII